MLYIDGIDAAVAYGVAVAKGGYNGIVQFPEMVEPNKVEWPEESGFEPDLLSPRLKPKESVRVDFICSNAPAGTDAMISALRDGSHHVFNFKEIAVTVPLRYKQVVNRNRLNTLETFSLEMALDSGFLDESVLQIYEGESSDIEFNEKKLYFNKQLLIFYLYESWLRPIVKIQHKTTGLLLDGADISEFCCAALEGTDAEIGKPAPQKDNLIIKTYGMNGQLYPDENTVKGSRDVALPILLRAVNATEFWKKYTALLSALVAGGNRTLTWGGVTHKCYYQRQTVNEFTRSHASNEIWCKFDLVLCFYEGD